MKQISFKAKLALLSTVVSLASIGHAQATPTATQQLQLSAFGGLTGTYTNFEGGKNGSITAGVDLTLLSTPYVQPALELRGTYPVKGGHVDSQFDFLIGPRVEHRVGRFRPYADFLIGRGQINYLNGGYLNQQTYVLYLSSSSTVYSPGLGVNLELTSRWGAKADFQYQSWSTPATAAGTLHPKVTTLGVIYNFDFNTHRHRK